MSKSFRTAAGAAALRVGAPSPSRVYNLAGRPEVIEKKPCAEASDIPTERTLGQAPMTRTLYRTEIRGGSWGVTGSEE